MLGAIIARISLRNAFRSLNEKNLEKFMSYWADDAVFYYPAHTPMSGEIRGKKAIREWFTKFMARFDSINFRLKSVSVNNIFDVLGNNRTAVEWELDLVGIEGKKYFNQGVTSVTLSGAKVALVRDYFFDPSVAEEVFGKK